MLWSYFLHAIMNTESKGLGAVLSGRHHTPSRGRHDSPHAGPRGHAHVVRITVREATQTGPPRTISCPGPSEPLLFGPASLSLLINGPAHGDQTADSRRLQAALH